MNVCSSYIFVAVAPKICNKSINIGHSEASAAGPVHTWLSLKWCVYMKAGCEPKPVLLPCPDAGDGSSRHSAPHSEVLSVVNSSSGAGDLYTRWVACHMYLTIEANGLHAFITRDEKVMTTSAV